MSEAVNITINQFPNCPKCKEGTMLPLSTVESKSVGGEGLFSTSVATSSATKTFDVWQCSNCLHHTGKCISKNPWSDDDYKMHCKWCYRTW